jgi:hypothetical protein
MLKPHTPHGEGMHFVFHDTAFQRKKTIAKASTDFIRLRIQTTREPQVTFAAFSLSQLVTGTCDLAR